MNGLAACLYANVRLWAAPASLFIARASFPSPTRETLFLSPLCVSLYGRRSHIVWSASMQREQLLFFMHTTPPQALWLSDYAGMHSTSIFMEIMTAHFVAMIVMARASRERV